jgi:hypothetical protein
VVGGADYMVGLIGGADTKVTVTDLFLLAAGTGFQVNNTLGDLQVDPLGNIQLTVASAAVYRLWISTSLVMSSDLTIGTNIFGVGGALIFLDLFGSIFIQSSGPPQFVSIQYAVANPGDWAFAPAHLIDAVDRIARVVSNFGANPIP